MKKNTIFRQLVQLLSRKEFKASVNKREEDKYTEIITCWQLLLIILFAQIKELWCLRDIDTGKKSRADDWKEIGVVSAAQSTLADPNADRDSGIYEAMFY